MPDCACNHFPSALGNVTFDAGINVGIGTASPATPLEVDGAGELMRLNGTGPTYYLMLRTGGTQYGQVGIGSGGHIFTGALPNSLAVRAETSLHLGSGGDGLTLTVTGGGGGNPGQVGVGTTSPAYTLDVTGLDTPGSGIRVATRGYTQLPPTLGTTPGVVLNARGLNVAQDGASVGAGPSSGVGIAVNRGGPALTVRNQGGYAATFEAGNVGIGTPSPAYPLDVNGVARVSGVLLVGQDVTLNGKINRSIGGALVDQGGCYYA